MTEEQARSELQHEVVVTDIRMPFWSMVIFMVKWAIAAIPAFLLLLVLGALFWGVAAGLLMSIGRGGEPAAAGPEAASAPVDSGDAEGTPDSTQDPEAAAYVENVLVREVKVSKSVLGEPGVFGEIKNSGSRTLKEVELTIYALDKKGNPIFEKTYHPVRVSEYSFGDEAEPLKPGYGRQFGVKFEDAPSEWSRKVDVKVTRIVLQ